jgi:hypothetical protein
VTYDFTHKLGQRGKMGNSDMKGACFNNTFAKNQNSGKTTILAEI